MTKEFERTLAELAREDRDPGRCTLGGAIDRLASAAFEAYGAVDGIESTGLVLPARLDGAIRDAWRAAATLLTEAALLDGNDAWVLDLESGAPAVSALEQARNFYGLALMYPTLADAAGRDGARDGGGE